MMVTHALAFSLRAGGKIDQAYALASGDGRIAASMAQKRAGADATAADRIRADALARGALRQDATAIDAVVTLGLDAQIRNDKPVARRLLAYAQKLSRRNLQTQLWAVEGAVARGDVPGALRNYDIALRTSAAAPGILFPVLAAAVAEPAIRQGLIGTLAGRPSWSMGFTDYIAANDPNPRATAALFRGLYHANVPTTDDSRATVIASLLASGSADEAWGYYALLHPGADRRMSRDPSFAGVPTPSPLDWVPSNDAALSASIQRAARGGLFDFAVPPSIGGPLLSQVQMLPPGSYRLTGHSANLDQPDSSRPYWALSCSGGRELGRVVMPNSAQGNGSFSGQLDVPAGCPVQVLSLIARPSDLVSGVAGQIDRVQLRPVH